ncbi:uncharacterized protein [Primulina eburnea]|uniref:uncharacterized protein n=1 Tax=Primulina eburnea TaxID=1245227 RepID=UPI003C6CAA6A
MGFLHLYPKPEAMGAIHGAKACRRAPSISHLMFDDCILFFRAEAEESNQIVDILKTFEAASGQATNLNKSGISFSRNVSPATQADISAQLGVWNPLNTGKYLGLPSLIGSKKRAIFAYLKDRLWKRIQGWNGRPISKAGKEVLIKSIAQAIPSYCMQIFLLPVSLADELQRMMNSYWWGSRGNSRGIRWTKWDQLCVKKKNGGMGFRNLHGFNLAMLGKQDLYGGVFGVRRPYFGKVIVGESETAAIFPSGQSLGCATTQNLGDIAEITAIPLITHTHDLRIWSHSRDENYTVRSGYHLAMNTIYTGRGNAPASEWDKLWDLNILAWRTVHNWLPTRINLQSKRVMVPSTCANFASMFEQPWHLFYTCPYAQECWEISDVKNEIKQSPAELECFVEWFFHILGKLDVERRQSFVMTALGNLALT